ncbi:MAG: AAA family ATPase [Firmicutes bacterium]|nr:AAA family ATPase [Bacillota bacterium]
MESIFEKVKERVKISEVVAAFGITLNRADKGLCPFHEERNPSFSVKDADGIFKCFSCDVSGDIFDFVSRLKSIEALEAAELLADMFGIDRSCKQAPKKLGSTPVKPLKAECEANVGGKQRIKDYLERCKENVAKTNYFVSRGLSQEVISKYFLGFDEEKRQAIIPYSSKLDYYQARSIESKKFFKPKTEEAGAEPIWNKNALASKGVVFVVESPICALSIIQSGGEAVSINGTGAQKLIAEVKSKKPKCILALSLDNDEAGKTAQQELANQLYELGVRFVVSNIAGGRKDPNELLMASPNILVKNIQEAVVTAKKEFSSLKGLFSAKELQGKVIKPIRWIVRELLPEGLTIVCAPSKYGKSWMMMQLCTAVTQGLSFLGYKTEECDCVYFSLEDSERRFQSRLNKTLAGKVAPHNFFGSVTCKTMGNGFFEQMEELMATHPKIGLIIVDTFQKIRGGQGKTESAYAADYRELSEFKAFADKHRVCVLLVHHLRKQIDDGDIFNMINGSTGVMATSDTSWILARKKRSDTDTAFVATGRDVSDVELVLNLDKSSFHWGVVGTKEDQAYLAARREYESNPVIMTIKSLVDKNPHGWGGKCSDIKRMIYEESGKLYLKSVESIGKVINGYSDKLLADGIEHRVERGKRHFFVAKKNLIFGGFET